MINYIKKFNIFIIALVILLTSSISAYPLLNQLQGRDHDYENTFSYLSKGPDLTNGGELLVLGDSFGFLFCEHVKRAVNYVVHQGYDVAKIYNEFLPLIEKDRYKYCFLMIGPNDFMMQTDVPAFKSIVQLIVNDLKSKGMQVIVTDYCDPDYNSNLTYSLSQYPLKCWQYDSAIKEVKRYNDLLYVEMRDLLNLYGRLPMDPVHPDKALYNPLLERVEKTIENDKILRGIN